MTKTDKVLCAVFWSLIGLAVLVGIVGGIAYVVKGF